MEYGSGAIFGCPAHDQRDLDFARKYELDVIPVVAPEGVSAGDMNIENEAFVDDGLIINSAFLDGLNVEDGKKKAIEKLIQLGQGESQTTYRLRDWGVSRQRYWGCPVPVIHCAKCGTVPVPEEDLPVTLPDDVEFEEAGNLLDRHPTWKHVDCPVCGSHAVRETDTFDTFFEFHGISPSLPQKTKGSFFRRMKPITGWPSTNISAIEHAILHLLYSRFFTRALRDCGYLDVKELFAGLLTQGMVCHETYREADSANAGWLFPEEVSKNAEGDLIKTATGAKVSVGRSEKMSKSRKNVVDPEAIIDLTGPILRVCLCCPTARQRGIWSGQKRVLMVRRYTNRLWRL